MKKTIYILITLIIIAGGYYFYDKSQKQAKAPNVEALPQPSQSQAPSPTQVVKTTPSATPSPKTNQQGGTFSSGEYSGDGSSVQVYEVDYDGSKFTPASIDINQNDYIFFKNNSTTDFWPASGPHPSHTDYPAFDPKAPVAPGKTFKFQFTKIGSWHYHDHLNEQATGVVNVK